MASLNGLARDVAMTPQLEFLMRLSIDVGEIISMGWGPVGERRVVNLFGGIFEGPRIKGEVLPGGADWQILRADDVLDINARYTLKEQRGGLVQVVSQGYRHGPEEVMMALGRGEDVEAKKYFFRTIMRFETGAPELKWLNKTIAISTGKRQANRVVLNAYSLL